MKGTKEDVKRQKHSQASVEGCVPSSQDSHPSSSLRCGGCGEFIEEDQGAIHRAHLTNLIISLKRKAG